jgi:hypothetical protein
MQKQDGKSRALKPPTEQSEVSGCLERRLWVSTDQRASLGSNETPAANPAQTWSTSKEESRVKGEKTMNSKHGVLDIPRESNQRQRRIRMIIYSIVGVAAVAGVTVFLAHLKPAAPVVDKTAVWIDTVKKGPMVIGVRALGTVVPQTKGAKAPSNSTTVQLRIPQEQAKDVRIGEAATIDTHNGIVPGHVAGVVPDVIGGVMTVEVKLDGPAPEGTKPGQEVDGTVEVEKLDNVMFVGRPVFGQPNTTISLYKVDPDGNGANLVQVHLGRASVNTIEVLSGLQPADKVILSDMSAWDSFNRIRLE